MPPDNPNYLKGAAFGFAAVSIWASWSVITRLAVTTSLDAWDIAALRFGVAGLLLSPVLVRRGLSRDRLGWLGLAVIIAGLGAPYALAAAGGLHFAPARDQGALNPGCMPLFVALIAAIVLREKLSTAQKLGLSLIFAGALTIVGWHAAAWSTSRTLGDALFLFAGFLTACGTVAMRQAKLDPLHAAALVSSGSLVIFLPFYLAFYGSRPMQLPLAEFAVQAIFQGVLVTIISLILYGRTVAILGASGGAAFGALVPALSALFAIPLLGEWPNETDWAGIVLISAGVYLASGGPTCRYAGTVSPGGTPGPSVPDSTLGAYGGGWARTCGRVYFDRPRSVFSAATLIRGYIRDMITGPLIAEIAALVGEPARATMLSALLDGRALTASELAYAARVTPQTASTHLAKLTEAGLLSVLREGRHRYFRLASPKVAGMLDGIVAVALENRPRYRPLSRQAQELSAARICYDHLAGRLSVDLTDFFTTHEYIVIGDDAEAAVITQAGTRFLTEFGIDLSTLSSTRRHVCRLCLDWTERRPHIAGAVGAALTKRYFDLGWTERMKHSGAVIVTASGKHGFRETFGIGMPEETGNGMRGQ